jgi:predicted metalloprotease with PDZ domain
VRRLAAAALGACLIGAAPATAPVEYRLSPVLSGGRLESLAVEVAFRGDPDGITDVRLPDRFTGHSGLHVYLAGFSAPGAEVARAAPDLLRLRHAPSASVTLRYRVTPGRGAGSSVDYRPDIAADGFLLVGETAFAWPSGRLSGPARARMAPLPGGWSGASSLDTARTVEDVRESVSVGGGGVRVLNRLAGGAPVQLAFRGALTGEKPEDAGVFADTLARVLEAQRAVSGEPPRPFVGVVQTLPVREGRYTREGLGRAEGLLLFLAADEAGYGMSHRILAHEAVHTWLPRRVGGLPAGMAEPGGYWFSEGFADFVGFRSLVRGEVWSAEAYASMLNVHLSSDVPAEGAGVTNAQIVAGYGRDAALFQLPYRRGHGLAMLWTTGSAAPLAGGSASRTCCGRCARGPARGARPTSCFRWSTGRWAAATCPPTSPPTWSGGSPSGFRRRCTAAAWCTARGVRRAPTSS